LGKTSNGTGNGPNYRLRRLEAPSEQFDDSLHVVFIRLMTIENPAEAGPAASDIR
jgi:hypothetical protein